MIFRRFFSIAKGVRFLATNLKRFDGLPSFPEIAAVDGMRLRACTASDVRSVLALRKELDGYSFSWATRMLLKVIPGKCCLVISDRHGVLSGMSFFYFNERDIRDMTIHEGFIGIKTECEGKGLATSVRRFAADHFSRVGTLRGISSRITLSNVKSVASGLKAGYEQLETYTDAVSGEERTYFINRFGCEVRE